MPVHFNTDQKLTNKKLVGMAVMTFFADYKFARKRHSVAFLCNRSKSV